MMNWKSKRLWIAAVLLLLFLLGFAINISSGRGLEREMARWRAEGLPTNYRELDDWYPSVPAHENAALVALDAAALHVTSAELDKLELPGPGVPLDNAHLAAIKTYLDKNKEALAKLDSLPGFDRARYPVQLWQGMNATLQHLSGLKGLVQLLRWKALLCSAEGQRAEAVRSIRTGFAVARTMRDEPTLISELVRIAIVSINIGTLERVLSQHQLTPDEINSLLADLHLAETEGQRAMTRAFIGERANSSYLLTADFGQLAAMGGPLPSSGSRLLGSTIYTLYKATGLRNRDLRIYLETINGFIGATTNAYPGAVQLAIQAEETYSSRTTNGFGRMAILSRMLLPALMKAVTKEGIVVSRIRCARAALLVEAHRASTGAIPENLSAFNLPPDGVKGEPIVLARQSVGYRINAPGVNEVGATKAHPMFGFYVAR